MGRKHKEHSKGKQDYLDEIEAREKIKRSILKVFRARLSSPGQGGALVVGPYSTSSPSESDRAAASEDDSSASFMSSSSSSINGEKREKRQIVNHDTHRKRSRRKRKTSDKKKHSVGRDSSTNIKKHLSAAHNVAYAQASSKKDPWQGSSFIARTRLTQRLGLFNQGKKSKTVHREPLRCPEHILRQTEQELKEILNNRELGDLGARLDADQELSSSNKSAVQNGTSNQRHILENSASCANTKSVPDDSADDFPESVPLQEVADYLLSSIKPQKFFLGRDLVKERVDELCKAMRQNAPRSATPTPDLRLTQQSGSVNRSLMESLSSSVATGHSDNNYAKHQNRVEGGHSEISAANLLKNGNKPSSTVWRNSSNSQETLMDTSETQTNMQNSSAHKKCETQSNAEKLLSHSHLSNFKTCVNQHEMKTWTQSDLSSLKKGDHQLLEQLKENVCSDHQNNHNEGYPTQRLMKVDGNMRMYGEHPSDHKKRECGRKERCHKSPGINLDDVPFSEAQVLLRLNEKKMAEASSQEELMETEEHQMSMDSDAKDLLRRNELAFARRQTLSSCREKLEVSQQKNLLYPACIVDQIGLNVCSSGERINPTVYQVKRPAALLYPSHNINTEERHQAVVTEYNNREYMPHFHGDYYAHQLCVKEPSKDFQDHLVGKTTRDSFDILDYLDKDIIVHRPRRTIVIEATPDSDGSPVWSAAEDAFIPRNPLRRGINDLAFKMLPRHQFL